MTTLAPGVAERLLEHELSYALGRRVALLERRPLPYRSSFAIDELELVVDGEEPVRLLLKQLDASALCDEAGLARPSFLRDGSREIAIYREVLPALGDDVPALHGSFDDRPRRRCWLLLEHVDGVPLWQLGASEAWDAAARWLARLHTAEMPRSAALRRYDAPWHRRWLARALAQAPAGVLDRVAAGHEQVLRRLDDWPTALVHGEFYPSNVLVSDGGERVRIVDWEVAGIGPGISDLAALTAGWSQPDRDRLVATYHEAWQGRGGRASLAELEDALEHARLLAALQWIGWSPAWTPPAPHARDWLDEALRAAELLGL